MADRYWVGGSGTWNSSSTARWSATSGGAPGASAPTSSDNVFFNSATTYTVTADGGFCRNITVSAGVVTFNNVNTGSTYFTCDGNISIIAATVFTAPVNGYAVISHNPSIGGAVTVSFGSSGANTQKIYFSAGVFGLTSYTFCNAATQTFHAINITNSAVPFVCAGSTITIDNQDRNGNVADEFSFGGTTLSVAGTTVNMGTLTATTQPNICSLNITAYPPTTAEPTLSGFNVIQTRAYVTTNWSTFWQPSTGGNFAPFRFGNITLKGSAAINSNFADLSGVYGAAIFTATEYNQIFINGSQNGAFQNKIFSGAFTLNGVPECYLDDSLSTVTFSSTVNLTTGSLGRASTLNLTANANKTITFTGAVTMTGNTNNGTDLLLPDATVNFSSTLTSTAPINTTDDNGIFSVGGTVTVAGTTSLTNTSVSVNNWVQTTTSSFLMTRNPVAYNSFSTQFAANSLTMGTGEASFTSSNISLQGVNGSGFALQSGGPVTVTGANTTNGVYFTANGNVSFTYAPSPITWTDVYIQALSFNTGLNGFILNGTTKNSNVFISGAWTSTGTVLNIAANLNPQIDSFSGGGGASFTINGVSGSSSIFTITGQSANTVFGLFTSSNIGLNFSSNVLTFNSTVSITNPLSISIYSSTNTTIGGTLSITSATLADGLTSTFEIWGDGTLTTSSTVTNWTFTNTRLMFRFASNMTIANPVSLVNDGGLYFKTSNLTLTSALSSSGASKYNILAATETGRTLTLNGAVTLVNCQLAAETIIVLGGATRNFAYSLSTPVPSNISGLAQDLPYGVPYAASYPEICVNAFTLSTTGGTFSIAGGGNATLRTFFRPYTISGSPACTLTLPALTPTLTDVDFWRVTVAGAVTKPLTGTRVGNVGTISGITPTTPKTVYWSSGTGTWDGVNWATTSGGAGSALNYPLPQDTVVFDANSGTGNFTYPASIRVGTIQVDAVPAGTSAVYCNAASILAQLAPAYIWVSGSIFGPPSTPTGTFVLGNTSTDTYDSFEGATALLQSLVVADGSSGDTHVLRPTNIRFMPRNSLQFATLGTTDIQASMTERLFAVGNYSNDPGTINITAAQIGSSSYNYAGATTSYIALGFDANVPFSDTSYGTVNYGNCALYTNTFYVNASAPNTAYSVFINRLIASSSTTPTLGSINFTQGGTGSTNYIMLVYGTVSCLAINVVSKSSFGTTGLTFNNSSAIAISTYALTVTYSGSSTTSFLSKSGSAGTLTKLGGGTVGLTAVSVTSLNASPANTWYTTGTITNSTGWNAGAAPAAGKGTFLIF